MISVLLFVDFKRGFLLLLCSTIALPSTIRFIIGSISISCVDFFSLSLLLALFFQIVKSRKVKIPKKIFYFFVIDYVSSFLLIFMSSQYVPIEYQLTSYFKGKVLHELVFSISALYAFSNIDIQKDFKPVWIVAICCGLYGIIAYYINVNPYITGISIVYTGEEETASHFIEEVRAGLSGRTYGTALHPLAWGQLWNLFTIFVITNKRKISYQVFYLLIAIGVVNIVLSGSRSALLALVFSLMIYILCIKRSSLIKLGIAICVTFPFVFVLLSNIKSNNDMLNYAKATFFFWDDSYAKNANIGGSGADMRRNQFDIALSIALNNPFGIGYDYQMYALEEEKEIDSGLLGLESVIYKKLVEQGIIGIIVFVFCIWLLISQILEKGKTIHNNLMFLSFSGGYLLSICFTGLQGSNWQLFISFSIIYYYLFSNISVHSKYFTYLAFLFALKWHPQLYRSTAFSPHSNSK